MDIVPIMAKTLLDKNGNEISLHAHVAVPSGSAGCSGVVKAGGADEVCVEVYESRRYWFRPEDVEVVEIKAAPENDKMLAHQALALAQDLSREVNRLGQQVAALEELHEDVRTPPPTEDEITLEQHKAAETYAAKHNRPIGG